MAQETERQGPGVQRGARTEQSHSDAFLEELKMGLRNHASFHLPLKPHSSLPFPFILSALSSCPQHRPAYLCSGIPPLWRLLPPESFLRAPQWRGMGGASSLETQSNKEPHAAWSCMEHPSHLKNPTLMSGSSSRTLKLGFLKWVGGQHEP